MQQRSRRLQSSQGLSDGLLAAVRREARRGLRCVEWSDVDLPLLRSSAGSAARASRRTCSSSDGGPPPKARQQAKRAAAREADDKAVVEVAADVAPSEEAAPPALRARFSGGLGPLTADRVGPSWPSSRTLTTSAASRTSKLMPIVFCSNLNTWTPGSPEIGASASSSSQDSSGFSESIVASSFGAERPSRSNSASFATLYRVCTNSAVRAHACAGTRRPIVPCRCVARALLRHRRADLLLHGDVVHAL